MSYRIFVDESGPFAKDRDTSIVGGFVTDWDEPAITCRIAAAIRLVAETHHHRFDRRDVHMAPLLFPERAFSEADRTRLTAIPAQAREAFAAELLRALKEMTTCVFMSVNDGFSFGTENEQSRYGANLMAALQAVMRHLGNPPDGAVEIAIAPRGQACLRPDDDREAYHAQLAAYVRSVFSVPVRFSRSFQYGFDMADVACHHLRRGLIEKVDLFGNVPVVRASPRELGARDAAIGVPSIVARLVEAGEICTAYRLADKAAKADVLGRLEGLQGKAVLGQLPLFVEHASELIERRTVERDALREAYDIARTVCRLAWRELSADRTNRQALDLCLVGLECATTCVNHVGITIAQDGFTGRFEQLLQDNGHLLPGAAERRERSLAFRNRAWNREFNDYQFARILDRFQATVDQRVQDIGAETDELTGEMCGTIGQAHAFLARTEPSHAETAEAYLERSLRHFLPTHRYHAMSVNFLATLHWQSGRLPEAVAAFGRHAFLAAAKPMCGAHGGDAHAQACAWLGTILSGRGEHPGTPFDVACLLRMLGESPERVPRDLLDRVAQWARGQPSNEHPHELVAKWLGLLFMLRDIQTAITWTTRAVTLCSMLGFAVRTIGLSPLGLRAVGHARSGAKTAAEADVKLLVRYARELCQQSTGFADYLDESGGVARMRADVEKQDVNAIVRWLPFAYA